MIIPVLATLIPIIFLLVLMVTAAVLGAYNRRRKNPLKMKQKRKDKITSATNTIFIMQ